MPVITDLTPVRKYLDESSDTLVMTLIGPNVQQGSELVTQQIQIIHSYQYNQIYLQYTLTAAPKIQGVFTYTSDKGNRFVSYLRYFDGSEVPNETTNYFINAMPGGAENNSLSVNYLNDIFAAEDLTITLNNYVWKLTYQLQRLENWNGTQQNFIVLSGFSVVN